MKQLAVVVVALLAACKEQPKPQAETSARGTACTSALASFDRYVDIPEAEPAQRAQVKAALHARCLDDNWSEPALACMRKARSSHEMFQCWNQSLTPQQREAASKSLGALDKR